MLMKQKTQTEVLNLSFLRINVSVRLKNPTGNFLILHLLDRFCRKRNSLHDPAASALCAAALAENTDAAHIAPVCGDLRQLCTAGPEQGQYDFAACNPPYFTAGPRSPDPRRAEARHTGSCTTADAVDCARRALRDGGRFLLCQRPEQLAEILAALRAARLEPKRLAFVKNRPDAAPWLFLVEAQKGRKTGLRVEPDILIQSGAALYGPTAL